MLLFRLAAIVSDYQSRYTILAITLAISGYHTRADNLAPIIYTWPNNHPLTIALLRRRSRTTPTSQPPLHYKIPRKYK